ncbi:MAG: hypothetical protein AB1393_04770 [Candidatus Edwardsbacteria bacterium]
MINPIYLIPPGIFKKHYTVLRIILFIMLGLSLLFCSIMIYSLSKKFNLTDFNTFWNIGRHFVTGESLYQHEQTDYRRFYYLPTAAMFFALLPIFPLKIAQAIFNVLNFWLWLTSIAMMYKILLCLKTKKESNFWKPFIGANILTIPFF